MIYNSKLLLLFFSHILSIHNFQIEGFFSYLAFSKHRLSALYDAFTKTNALGSEEILALMRAFY